MLVDGRVRAFERVADLHANRLGLDASPERRAYIIYIIEREIERERERERDRTRTVASADRSIDLCDSN